MMVHVAHICMLRGIFAVLNIQVQICEAASLQSEPTLSLFERKPGMFLVCEGLWLQPSRGRKVTVPSLEGLGRVPDCHTSSRLFKQPLKMEMHSLRFKRRNRPASESTSPLPLNVSMQLAPPSCSCHHPQTVFFSRTFLRSNLRLFSHPHPPTP